LSANPAAPSTTEVAVPVGDAVLEGELVLPAGAVGVVLFAHGSGSSRQSPRNRKVAATLNEAGIGTLLVDLLTPEEEEAERLTAEHRFDIQFLARRLIATIDWIGHGGSTRSLPIGLFGASTGAAAALVAAAERQRKVAAVVSRGGRPDLARSWLPLVRAPTLLIVGGADELVLELNRRAFELLRTEKHLAVVPGATHLFEEPGALEQVAWLATEWFLRYLREDDVAR
jgi:putative phosphoribosyl transferase